jgi:hypothetical protein
MSKLVLIAIGFILGFLSLPTYCFLRYDIRPAGASGFMFSPKSELTFSSEQIKKVFTGTAKTSKDCARSRWLIKTAVLKYNRKGSSMKSLTLFELIGKNLIQEVPNCPSNGTYSMSYKQKSPEIRCSEHGITQGK